MKKDVQRSITKNKNNSMIKFMSKSIRRNTCCFLLIAMFNPLVLPKLYAQKKFSLELNVGALHSIGKDITKKYDSNIQPLTIYYFSRKKFEHTYFNLLPNLHYSLRSNVRVGLQSGIYAHFNEEYSGYRIPVLVTVPLQVTGRVDLANIKSNSLGINVAGGKNFFKMKTYPYDVKNGWLFNASVFYLLDKKSIFKLGIEQQVDNGYIYQTSSNPFTKDETFKYNLNRVSIALSYAWVIKKF